MSAPWWTEADQAEKARLMWAAMMLSRKVEDCEAILASEPVLVANLEGEALRRAYRGGNAPPRSEFIIVQPEHLQAIAAAGPFTVKAKSGN